LPSLRSRLHFEPLEDRCLLSLVPHLLKDIGLGDPSNPTTPVDVNGTAYFLANDGTHGRELWKSDGTDAGTVLLKDIRPGTNGSGIPKLVNSGGTLFFSATDGTTGYALWKSDGTAAGTTLVKDIWPVVGTNIRYVTDVGGTLFFSARDGTNGTE